MADVKLVAQHSVRMGMEEKEVFAAGDEFSADEKLAEEMIRDGSALPAAEAKAAAKSEPKK